MEKVLIVDDHASVGDGTKAILDAEFDFQVEVISSSTEVSKKIKHDRYDIYIVDLHMPGVNGLDLTTEIIKEYPDAKVIIYTGYEISIHFNFLVKAGVSGFISKSSSSLQLCRAIRCALDGEAMIPLDILPHLRKVEGHTINQAQEIVVFTEKEEDILLKVAKGMTNDEIADALFMSRRSVERHLTGLFRKVNVNSRAMLIVKGLELGIISDVII